MLVVVIASLIAMLASVLVHYEALRALSFLTPRLSIPPRRWIIVVVLSMLLAHLAEVALYAGVFWTLPWLTDVEDLGLNLPLPFLRCVYYSLESYGSLGSVDFPDGMLRIPAGVEALNGLILIGWTASYTYLVMREFWAEDLVARSPMPEYHYRPDRASSPFRERMVVDDDPL